MDWLCVGLLVTSFCLIAYAALHDLAVRTIPDQVVAALGLLGVAAALTNHHFAGSLLVAACLFASCFVIWWFGALGGGDVKLIAVASLMFPPVAIPQWIVAVALAGGILSMFYLGVRHRVDVGPVRHTCLGRIVRAERWRMRRGGPLPYAVAIAGGSCFQFIR
jgi:prepilin peptidase CpaA